MANELTTFSFDNVAILIDGVPGAGLWEGDDVVSVVQNKPDGNAVVGVDGKAIVSRPVDQSVNITIQASPNGTLHRLLTNKKRSIDNNVSQNFAISITDTGNGEGGSSVAATIIQPPSMVLGENASARTWVIFANNWRQNEITYSN